MTQFRIRTLICAVATAAAVASAAIAAQPSNASPTSFYYGAIASGASKSSGYVSNVRAIYGFSESYFVPSGPSRKVGVSASNSGTWVFDWDAACHSYAAGHYFFSSVQNPHTVSQNPMEGDYDTADICPH